MIGRSREPDGAGNREPATDRTDDGTEPEPVGDRTDDEAGNQRLNETGDETNRAETGRIGWVTIEMDR